MEKLSDDEVGQIMRRVSSRSDRRACAQVGRQWQRVEGLTRTSLRVHDPQLMHHFLPRFRNLLVIEAQMELFDPDLECMAENCHSLRVLNLHLTSRWRGKDLKCLSSYQTFKPFGDRGVEAIASGCKLLENISLRWRQGIGDIAVSTLAQSCRLLVNLNLGHCKRITDQSLHAISHLECLEVLILKNCSLVTDWGISCLASGPTNKCLKRLDLFNCDRLTDSGALLLQQLSALQNLNLARCGKNITDTGGTGLAGATLQRLNLSWLINVGDVTIMAIAHHCTDLEELNLSGCELVTGTGIRSFSGHKKLRVLILHSCSNFHSDDVDAMASACPGLQYLYLDRRLGPWMPEECLERLQTGEIKIQFSRG